MYLYPRWERADLVFYDLATGRRIATLEDEQEARAATDARANSAEAALSVERDARIAAEARVWELEELLQREGS